MGASPLSAPRPPKLTESQTQALLQQVRTGSQSAREQLASSHLPLVYSVAQRFAGRGREMEDLCQVGSIGLIKAIDKFDPQFGVCFSTYAVPMIMGEIRRYLRDDNPLHVSRSLKETAVRILRCKERLQQQAGREPTLEELAQVLALPREEIVLALDAVAEPLSLQEQVYGEEASPTIQDQLRDQRHTDDALLEHISLQEAIGRLKERERQVVELRYFQGKTQAEVAGEIGVSQAQVSRLEKGALQRMREHI